MLACAASALINMPDKIMLTQQEWVEGCYAYYAENYYEPGNPEDGEWEDAHYPVPKCEGGEVTIKLLKHHHALQGVLQSEEYGRPCIWGWEANYLEGEMLEMCKKWLSEHGRRCRTAQIATTTPEQRSEANRRGRLTQLAALTPEVLSERARKGAAGQTPEQRSETSRRAQAARTPEQRRAIVLKGKAAMTPEQRSEAARKGWATRAANRLAREAAMLQSVTKA